MISLKMKRRAAKKNKCHGAEWEEACLKETEGGLNLILGGFT